MIAFTVDEILELRDNEFENRSEDVEYTIFVKTRVHLLPCECCSENEVVTMTKNDDGTFHVTYQPAYGSDEFKDCATFAEALDAF